MVSIEVRSVAQQGVQPDAAGAAPTSARLFGVVVCFHVSSSRRRRAADADVGPPSNVKQLEVVAGAGII